MTQRLRGQYDAIVSLGRDCMVAYQLDRLGLRRCSGPFDWIVLHAEGLIDLFRNGLYGFAQFENLVAHESYVPGYWLVEDRKYDAWFYHEFKQTPGNHALYDYNEEREILDRRVERLRQFLESDRNILFVRKFMTEQDALELSRILRTIRGKGSSDLLCINTEDFETEYHLHSDGLHFATILSQSDPEKAPDSWKGNDTEWDEIFRGVSIAYVGGEAESQLLSSALSD